MKKVLALTIVLVLVLSALAMAGQNPNVKGAIHVLGYNAKLTCTKFFPVINRCSDINTTYPGTNVHFFPTFYEVTCVLGVEYGVTWEGGTCMFTNCASFIIGNIVNSGDGASHAWTTPQIKYAVIPGFGWITSYGTICMVDHPTMGPAKVADCQDPSQIDIVRCRVCAGTNGLMGEDPCAETATEQSTWGSIKAMFK